MSTRTGTNTTWTQEATAFYGMGPTIRVVDDRLTGYATENVVPLTPADEAVLREVLAEVVTPSGECE